MAASLCHVSYTELEITSLDKIELLDKHVCITTHIDKVEEL